MINPINHAKSAAEVTIYKVEPYVVAADIYRLEGQVGRCGWTWYTGSSGWMYRVWLEDVLGFKLEGNRLTIDPAIPEEWTHYGLRYRYHGTAYEILVENPEKVSTGVVSVELDGVALPSKWISLVDDGGQHKVRVRLGHPLEEGKVEGVDALPAGAIS